MFDHSLSLSEQTDFSYVNFYEQNVSYAQAPLLIAQRYIENFTYLFKSVFGFVERIKDGGVLKSQESRESENLLLGFNRILVFLTRHNTLIAINGYDSSRIWKARISEVKIERIFERTIVVTNAKGTHDNVKQLVAFTQDSIIIINPETGDVIDTHHFGF